MNSCADHTWRRPIVVLGAMALLTSALAAQSNEEFARRRLESGLSFLKAQNYVEALKDFEAVAQTYPTSSVADDALLQIAMYQLEIAHDAAAADARVKEILKTYSTSDSAAMAMVIEGRLLLLKGRGNDDINAALASFDRVPRLFPTSDAVPASMYYAGEAAHLGGHRDQAIQRFDQLAAQFPASPWTAKALLGSAIPLTRAGQPARAMEHLQRVRNQFPNSPEAAAALDLNTVLYRLYLRVPAQPAFVFSGRTVPAAPGKLKDVKDIKIDRSNTLLVASDSGIVAYGAKGTPVSNVSAIEPRAIAFDALGKFMTIHETGIRLEGKTAVTLAPPPAANGSPRPLKLEDAVVTSSGDYLVANRDQKNIMRFASDGRFLGEYARAIEARRLAINEVDEVAAIDSDTKAVTLFGRDAKILKQIAARGTGYQFRNPMDVELDAFGHIYVLDRASVMVFSPDGARLLTTFASTDKTPGAFGDADALALDTAGRLFVFDGRSNTVKVYR